MNEVPPFVKWAATWLWLAFCAAFGWTFTEALLRRKH